MFFIFPFSSKKCEFEDTKEVMRISKLKKRQHHGQKEIVQKDKQRSTKYYPEN